MSDYAIVIEKAENNYCAYVPDLPGCVTTGKTETEVRENIKEAIAGHLEVMRKFGEPVPQPTITSDFVR